MCSASPADARGARESSTSDGVPRSVSQETAGSSWRSGRSGRHRGHGRRRRHRRKPKRSRASAQVHEKSWCGIPRTSREWLQSPGDARDYSEKVVDGSRERKMGPALKSLSIRFPNLRSHSPGAHVLVNPSFGQYSKHLISASGKCHTSTVTFDSSPMHYDSAPISAPLR